MRISSTTLGQCVSDTRLRSEILPRWDDFHQTKDSIGLKDLIRSLWYYISASRHPTIVVLSERLKLHGHRQWHGQ